MNKEEKSSGRVASLARHLRRNAVAYLALGIAVSLSPLPSYAAGALVGTNQLADKSVTTAKLRGNAVTGPKIANGTIRKADIAAGTRGYTGVRTERLVEANVPQGASSVNTVYCPAGQVAVAGGAFISPGGFVGAVGGDLQVSIPISDGPVVDIPSPDASLAIGWRTETVNDLGDGPKSVIHYVMCAAK